MSTITLTPAVAPSTSQPAHAATRTVAPRHQMFRKIHKGLRHAMGDALLTVGRVDTENATSITHAMTAVRGLLTLCRTHLHAENQFIHPAMEARLPGSSRATADEHLDHERAVDTLAADVLAVERSVGGARPAALAALYQRLALFVADNYTHMFEEETHNQSVLWEHYSDQELQALEGAIVASHTPEQLMTGLRWIIPALSPDEREQLLAGPRAGMPAAMFDQLLGFCVSLLQPAEGPRLRTAFCSGPRERESWPH